MLAEVAKCIFKVDNKELERRIDKFTLALKNEIRMVYMLF